MDQSKPVTSTTFSTELLQAQAELWRHTFGYLKSMALHCAIKLGIANTIHQYGGAASLSVLLAALPAAGPNKQTNLARLMRFLTMSGLFTCVPARACNGSATWSTEDMYHLTPVSRLLVSDTGDGNHTSLSPFVLSQITSVQLNAALHLAKWFGDEARGGEEAAETPFKMVHGGDFWSITCRDPKFGEVFNDGMGSDSLFAMDLVVREYPEVFSGFNSLLDVGGGKGMAAKTIAKAFPHIKCSVLDLPQVVNVVPADEMVEFIAGDMMEYIPSVDVVLLKYVLHDWSDEDCVKILTLCRNATTSSEKTPGKVIIIDAVVGSPSDTIYEAQLLLDLAMMVVTTGKEREEHEWQKIFIEAGFNSYKIMPILGILSIIELYPNLK